MSRTTAPQGQEGGLAVLTLFYRRMQILQEINLLTFIYAAKILQSIASV